MKPIQLVCKGTPKECAESIKKIAEENLGMTIQEYLDDKEVKE
jgi:hypothetical protein